MSLCGRGTAWTQWRCRRPPLKLGQHGSWTVCPSADRAECLLCAEHVPISHPLCRKRARGLLSGPRPPKGQSRTGLLAWGPSRPRPGLLPRPQARGWRCSSGHPLCTQHGLSPLSESRGGPVAGKGGSEGLRGEVTTRAPRPSAPGSAARGVDAVSVVMAVAGRRRAAVSPGPGPELGLRLGPSLQPRFRVCEPRASYTRWGPEE